MKRTLPLFLFLAACGTDGSAGEDFFGTWMYNAGSTSTVNCPGQAASTSPDTGSFMVTEGTMSDLIVVPPAGDKCPPQKYDVNGNAATIVAAQVCMYTENDPQLGSVMYNISYATGSFTLGADKKTVSGQGAGSVMLTASSGTVTCSFTNVLTATKVGN